MLADYEIKKAVQEERIGITPYTVRRLQPVSYDMTLSESIRVPRNDVHTIDPGMNAEHSDGGVRYYGQVPSWHPHTTGREIPPSGWTLRPRDFILACTAEYVRLPSDIAAVVEGKSSLGRLGLTVHVTAGFIDPGFEGQITLEIANLAPWGIKLYAGMPIAQLVFESVNPPERDYSKTGHYQGQTGPTESRYRL